MWLLGGIYVPEMLHVNISNFRKERAIRSNSASAFSIPITTPPAQLAISTNRVDA